MAVKHDSDSVTEKTVLDIGEVINQLEKIKQQAAGLETSPRPEEGQTTQVIALPEPPRFGKAFFWHLAIGVGLFVLAVVCLAFHVPVLGDPLALLVGPIVTIYLSWKHRP